MKEFVCPKCNSKFTYIYCYETLGFRYDYNFETEEYTNEKFISRNEITYQCPNCEAEILWTIVEKIRKGE